MTNGPRPTGESIMDRKEAGSAWASIAVQDVANMASGIDCLDIDGYQDNTTCIYLHEESLDITAPTGREPDFIEHLRAMQIHAKAGTKTEYVSANTNVLMLVIEAVTGKPYALALQELVWGPIGSEADALMAISQAGYAYASGGLHARLRDMARFADVDAHIRGIRAKVQVGLFGWRLGGIRRRGLWRIGRCPTGRHQD